MSNVNKRSQGGKRRKREWMLGAGLMAYLLGLLIRIPLGRMIGDKGIGFFAAGMEIAAVASIILSYGMSKSVSILIKYRMRREMYKSAGKVFKNALFLAIIFSGLAAAGVFLFSELIAETVVLEHMSYMAITAAAPAIFLSAVMGALKGYFQGMGTMIPTAHSKLLEKFVMAAASILMASILYSYGLKVAALLKNQEYAAAYGALGAALGLSIAGLAGLLHLLLIYFIYSGNFKQQLQKDSSKYVESSGQLISMLLSTALPYTLCALLFNLNNLADQRIFNYAANIHGKSNTRVLTWGIYYGKYSVVTGAAAILCTLSAIYAIPRIAQSFDRQEHRDAQYKLERSIHYLAVVSIPCAVIIAVLAEPVVGTLFKGDTKTAVSLLQAGTAVIVLFSFTYFLAGVLQRIRKIRVVIFGGFLAFLAHLAVVIVLINNTDLGIMAVVIGNIVFYFITCAVGLWGVNKYMQYTQEWFRTFIVTFIASGVSGLIGMLLCKALLGFAGNVITLIVGVPICFIVYNVLIILLKGMREDELEEIPGGRFIAGIAVKLHLL